MVCGDMPIARLTAAKATPAIGRGFGGGPLPSHPLVHEPGQGEVLGGDPLDADRILNGDGHWTSPTQPRRVILTRLLSSPVYGLSRTFDDAGCSSPGSVAAVGFLSGRVEHPRPQEHEPRPAVHLPLDRLQPVHMSLHGAVAPPLRHRRVHGRLVTTDALGEPPQVRV